MRRLWLAAWRVSRSHVRTRRSSAARAASGNWRGHSPAGSTSGRRARVSASMPLALAWRDRTRRRSWALAELTRYTVWPRAQKNTAIGSHAGPVGSITTSSMVPAGVPASAACSTCSRLSTVGIALRRHTTVPSARSTRTVWALVIPMSIPTNRRSSIRCLPWPWWPAAPAAPMGGAPRPRSQGRCIRRRHPLMCCNRPRPSRVGPLPSSGASVAGQGRQSDERGSAHQRLPQRKTQRHPRNQPGCTCNPGTMVPIKHRSPLHEDSNAPWCGIARWWGSVPGVLAAVPSRRPRREGYRSTSRPTTRAPGAEGSATLLGGGPVGTARRGW
jgi:hypothetical protein